MKKIIHPIIVLALIAIAFTEMLCAQVVDGYVSSIGASSPGATNSTVIFPADISGGKAIVLTSVTAVGDNAAATLQYYGGTTRTTLSSGQTSTNLTVVTTNGFAADDIVVIQSSTGTTSWGYIVSLDTSTINLDRDPGTFASGSHVFKMSNVGAYTVGNATYSREGHIWGAQKRTPLLVRCQTVAGTTELIKSATVLYYDPESQ